MMKRLFILITILMVSNSCTENPFSDDGSNKIAKEKISGYVELSDGVTPDNVFVWLEEFNLSTYTDSIGKFSFTLPLPENQGYGNGFDGKFMMYFYVNNYMDDSVEIEFSQGELLDDQKNIGNTGKFKEVVVLKPLFNFATTNFHECIEYDGVFLVEFENDNLLQYIDVKFEIYEKTIVAYSLREDQTRGFFRTGMIFVPLNPEKDIIFFKSSAAYNSTNSLVKSTESTWTFMLNMKKDEFEEISYQVYPYLFVLHPNLPDKMIEELGTEKFEFNENYLKLPIKKKTVTIKITKNSS